jgi:hypothetical protein
MDCRPVWKFRQNPVEHTISGPESSDAMTFYAREKKLVTFVNVDVPYQANEGVIFL